MKVLVCGGRDFSDYEMLATFLDRMHSTTPISCIVHGAARGADTLAGRWASANGIRQIAMPAEWRYGRKAGPLRNRQMLIDNPDIAHVVAFPGGSGTRDMIRVSREAGLTIWFPTNK